MPLNQRKEQEFYEKSYSNGSEAQFARVLHPKDLADTIMSLHPEQYLRAGTPKKVVRPDLRISRKDPKMKAAKYKVTPNGVVDLSKYKGQFSSEIKMNATKKLSFTAISAFKRNQKTRTLFTPVLFNLAAQEKLGAKGESLGLLLLSKNSHQDPNILPSLLYTSNATSYTRPHYSQTIEAAEKHLKQKTVRHEQELFNNDSNVHNEYLLRLKISEWEKIHVGLFLENFKTKISGQFFAMDMKINSKKKFFPISFYIHNKQPNKIFPYSTTEQQTDLLTALNSRNSSGETKAKALIVYWFNEILSGNFIDLNNKIQELGITESFLELFKGNAMSMLTKIYFLEKLLNINLRTAGLPESEQFSLINTFIKNLPKKSPKSLMTDIFKQALIQAATSTVPYIVDKLHQQISNPRDYFSSLDSLDADEISLEDTSIDSSSRSNSPTTQSNISALEHAIDNEDLTAIIQLLQQNPKGIDQENTDGLTPLLIACLNGNIDIVETLILAKANINYANKDGITALFLAIAEDNHDLDLIRMLMKHGAKPTQSDIIYLIENDKKEILEMLQIEYANVIQPLLTNMDKALLSQKKESIEAFDDYEHAQLLLALNKNDPNKAKTIITKIEKYAISQNPEQINVTLFTAYMHGRGGDVVSSILLIKEMIKKNPNIQITWVVKRDIAGYSTELSKYIADIPKENIDLVCIDSNDYKKVIIKDGKVYSKKTLFFAEKELSAEELRIMSNENWSTDKRESNGGWPELQKKMEDKQFCYKIAASHMFCVVPNLHRFVNRDRQFFKTLNKPFVAVSEYDFNTTKHTNDLLPDTSIKRKYELGFSGENLGVYIDQSIISSKDNVTTIHNDDKALQDFLANTHNSIEEYTTDHALYYGYFFVQDPTPPEANTSTIKLEQFVKNCILNALNNPNSKPNIDIVLPINDTNKLEKIWKKVIAELSIEDKRKISSVKLCNKIGTNFTESNKADPSFDPFTGDYSIRIINPTRVNRKTVQCLLNSSESLCGITGDQSWIEALMKGKLTCYQIMKWKEGFFDGFLKYVEKKFGQSSSIYQFYDAQKKMPAQQQQAWNKINTLYRTKKIELEKQAQELANYIKLEKDLYRHDGSFFTQIIDDAKKAKMFISKRSNSDNPIISAQSNIPKRPTTPQLYRTQRAQTTAGVFESPYLTTDPTNEEAQRKAAAEKAAAEKAATEKAAEEAQRKAAEEAQRKAATDSHSTTLTQSTDKTLKEQETLINRLIKALEKSDYKTANQIMNQMEQNHSFNSEDSIKVVMYTACCWGTMGDSSAAAKLMQQLCAIHPKIKFSWIIRIDRESQDKGINETKIKNLLTTNSNISVTTILDDRKEKKAWENGWKELWTNPDAVEKLQAADLLCVYPTGHYFKEPDYKKFQELKKPFVSITEYDFQHKDSPSYKLYRGAKEYNSGFSTTGIGVFINTILPKDLNSLQSSDESTYQKLVGSFENSENYFSQNQLFFGYFNSNTSMLAKGKLVNIEEYIVTCIKKSLAENIPPKNIDLFINVSQEQLRNILQKKPPNFTAQELNILGGIEYSYKDSSQQIQSIKETLGKGSAQIRIINGFPLNKTSMECLMQNADPFIGLTGDQSFVEGLACGKLVCYQQMQWKQDLFKNFVKYVKDKFGETSPIYQFYNAQQQKPESKSWQKLINIYIENKSTIQQQAKTLAELLIDEKQIDKNLFPKLIKDIEEAHSTRIQKHQEKAEQYTRLKAAEETQRKAAAEKAAAEKAAAEKAAAEEAAQRKATEEAAQRKATEEAQRKAAEEAAQRKATEEAAQRKAAEEAAQRKAAEEAAQRKAAEEAAQRKAAEETQRKAAEEAQRKAKQDARAKVDLTPEEQQSNLKELFELIDKKEQTKIDEMLTTYPILINLPNESAAQATMIHHAVRCHPGDPSLLTHLITTYSPDCDLPNKSGITPLYMAAISYKDTAKVKSLLKSNANALYNYKGNTIKELVESSSTTDIKNLFSTELNAKPKNHISEESKTTDEETQRKAAAEKAAAEKAAAEEAAQRKATEEAAQRKATEEAQRKAAEEAAQRKAAEEAAQRKAAEEAAQRKAAEEAAQRKAAEEAAQRKAAEEAAQRKATEEAAQRKATEEAQRKAAEEAAQRKAAEEAAQRKAAEEAAQRKTAEEAAQRKATEEAAQRKAAEEAAQRKAAEEAAQRKAEQDTLLKAEQDTLLKAEQEIVRLKAEQDARLKIEQENTAISATHHLQPDIYTRKSIIDGLDTVLDSQSMVDLESLPVPSGSEFNDVIVKIQDGTITLERLKNFLENATIDLLEQRNNKGLNIFHVAVTNGNLDIVKALLEKHNNLLNSRVNSDTSNDPSALYIAVKEKHWEIAKYLVQQGANFTSTYVIKTINSSSTTGYKINMTNILDMVKTRAKDNIQAKDLLDMILEQQRKSRITNKDSRKK